MSCLYPPETTQHLFYYSIIIATPDAVAQSTADGQVPTQAQAPVPEEEVSLYIGAGPPICGHSSVIATSLNALFTWMDCQIATTFNPNIMAIALPRICQPWWSFYESL